MEITSPAFETNEQMPVEFTCYGANHNPPLQFWDVPEDATSLLLIMENWDMPVRPFTHWLVFNIPPIEEEIEQQATFVRPTIEIQNSNDTYGYSGPCLETGTHEVEFRLFALDTMLDLNRTADRQEVEAAMSGHVMSEAELRTKFSHDS